MDSSDIKRKSIWRDKWQQISGDKRVQVLDVGVWIMDTETKKKRTEPIDQFLERFEPVKDEDGQ